MSCPILAEFPDEDTPRGDRDLTVWYGEMPESNGRRNYTASLHRKGGSIHTEGLCFARSEYPDRVRYEADRMRWIIGELADKPDILAYDPDLHSGYVDPNYNPSLKGGTLCKIVGEAIAVAARTANWKNAKATEK